LGAWTLKFALIQRVGDGSLLSRGEAVDGIWRLSLSV
jgi:hypothetical protein